MISIKTRCFGKTKDGKTVTAFDLRNENGMSVTLLDYGATVQIINVPDRDGKQIDVSLGYDDLTSYEDGGCFYGAVVGRYANRIGNARFVLDGREYQLSHSKRESNHLHGVFGKRLFESSVDGDGVTMRYFSPDMEEGFPGDLRLEVRYVLRDDNALEINYKAETNAPTVVNLTNHTYFNLNGQDGSTVFDHKVRLNSSFFTEYADSFAQTGRIISVENTPLDFRTEQTLGARFNDDYRQLRICTGYDHNMIVDGKDGKLKSIGAVRSEKTGILLEAFTTEPSFQFYSGNYMHFDPVQKGKNGVRYPKNGAICLEAQHYPDSVNHPDFPSTVLRPGDVYRQKTVYKFKVE